MSGVFKTLLPYFRKIETDLNFNGHYHGNAGPIPVSRFREEDWHDDQLAFYNSCVDAGFTGCPDHNHPSSAGVGPIPFNHFNGIRWSTALAISQPGTLATEPHSPTKHARTPRPIGGEDRGRRNG